MHDSADIRSSLDRQLSDVRLTKMQPMRLRSAISTVGIFCVLASCANGADGPLSVQGSVLARADRGRHLKIGYDKDALTPAVLIAHLGTA